jgi:hypothetical protein
MPDPGKLRSSSFVGSPSFYFPNLNRNQAEALLYGQESGVFLIRDSVLFKGRLTLSFIDGDQKFEHYIVERNRNLNNTLSIDKIKWFNSLNELIKVT